MANTKKYVSLDKLGVYDAKIKGVITTGDEATLTAAKKYADGLATNYDAAGSATTAEANAKSYTDGKIGEVNTTVAGVKTIAEQGVADAAKAQAAADKAQGEVDALELYVGTFTSENAKSVVEYINEKTSGIATDAALGELQATVTQLGKDVDAIEADYLVKADKEALQANIDEKASQTDLNAVSAVANAAATKTALEAEVTRATGEEARIEGLVTAEVTRATGVESGFETRIKAIEDDYLVAADKDALQSQINTIMNNPDAEGAINSINEFTQYVKDHGTIADGFRTDINANAEAIAANAKAISDNATLAGQTYATKTELANEKKALQDEIDADVKVVADDLADLSDVVDTKANQSALEEAVTTLQGKDTELAGKITALENKFSGEGSVEDQIADAKQAAIDSAVATAAADATTKANAAEKNAKDYADAEIDKVEGTIATLQGVVDGKAASSDLTALAGRVTTAEGEIDTLQSEMDAVEALAAAADAAAKANATAIATKASNDDLTAVSNRVTTLETWHNNFTEVSEDEINGLFTA